MSIQRRLIAWLLSSILLCAAVTAAVVYVQARQEANALFDYQLRQVALSLPTGGFGPLAGARPGIPGEADGVVVQIWDRNGTRLYLSHPASHLPDSAELGFSTVASQDGSWRIYSVLYDDDVIQVAQPLRVRSNLAAAVALRAVLPLLILLPLLGILTWIVVGRGLSPIRRVAQEVGQRSAQALEPLTEDDLPNEISPLVLEVNRLLVRLGAALDVQRAFVADAAHELRTPLTAVELQVQLVERATSDGERESSIAEVKNGLARLARLVEQLLLLARLEPEGAAAPLEKVDLAELARDAVSEATIQALAQQTDLGLLASGPVFVRANRDALGILLRNLIDNALRHGGPGSSVDVSVDADGATATLSVRDHGPGIEEDERARVFDRFYRSANAKGPGSGLGLAIVRNIAQRHGADIRLERPAEGGGLLVCVSLRDASAA